MENINILENLPQDYPFVFVDRVLELEVGKRILCQKNLTITDPVFQGHFPDIPLFPGVLIVEAMAQSSIILFKESGEGKVADDQVFVLGSVKSHFSHPVFPGDLLLIEVMVEKLITNAAIVSCEARVNQTRVAKATLTFGVASKSKLSS
jgi:3-hydroxyacyl-[acyl-carrier-protein] dehydratase